MFQTIWAKPDFKWRTKRPTTSSSQKFLEKYSGSEWQLQQQFVFSLINIWFQKEWFLSKHISDSTTLKSKLRKWKCKLWVIIGRQKARFEGQIARIEWAEGNQKANFEKQIARIKWAKENQKANFEKQIARIEWVEENQKANYRNRISNMFTQQQLLRWRWLFNGLLHCADHLGCGCPTRIG